MSLTNVQSCAFLFFADSIPVLSVLLQSSCLDVPLPLLREVGRAVKTALRPGGEDRRLNNSHYSNSMTIRRLSTRHASIARQLHRVDTWRLFRLHASVARVLHHVTTA